MCLSSVSDDVDIFKVIVFLHFSAAHNDNLLIDDDGVVSYDRSVESLGNGLRGDVVDHLVVSESHVSSMSLGLFDSVLRDDDVCSVQDDLVTQTETDVKDLQIFLLSVNLTSGLSSDSLAAFGLDVSLLQAEYSLRAISAGGNRCGSGGRSWDDKQRFAIATRSLIIGDKFSSILDTGMHRGRSYDSLNSVAGDEVSVVSIRLDVVARDIGYTAI